MSGFAVSFAEQIVFIEANDMVLTNIKIRKDNFEDCFYGYAAKDIMRSIGEEELKRLFSYKYCELGNDFVGFLYNYADLKELPKDFTIIDFGCYQAFQADYFKAHKGYIGIEPAVQIEFCLKQNNAVYYSMTGQEFIANNLRMLGLDLNKTFAICSNVPDKELHKLISETFPYHRIWYVDDRISEFYPVGFETGHYPVKED